MSNEKTIAEALARFEAAGTEYLKLKKRFRAGEEIHRDEDLFVIGAKDVKALLVMLFGMNRFRREQPRRFVYEASAGRYKKAAGAEFRRMGDGKTPRMCTVCSKVGGDTKCPTCGGSWVVMP